MEQLTIYRTSQGLEFDDPRQAQLAEDILAALDRFFDATESLPSPESYASLSSLKILKKAQGLTNRALANKAGVSPGMISDVLNCRVPLTDNMRQKLETALSQ